MSPSSRRAVEAPTLETERLKLRAHRLEDFLHCAAMWADPEVTRYIGGKPHTEEESWARLLRYAGHWSLLAFGYWVVEEKSTGHFIGEVGFADYKRDLPALKGLPEIGWAFTTQAGGKGYATEAVRAVITWGDTHFPTPRTACIIHPENLASIRVAEKCAYREFQRTTYKSHPTIMFVRDRMKSAP
jgi:RimJ/RimL family protein N-acetyltransferase